MNFMENLIQAWNAVVSNRKRSVLTIVGIVVGLSAVITIVSIGDTITGVLKEYLSQELGANTILGMTAELDMMSSEYQKEFLDNAPESVYDLLIQTPTCEASVCFENDDDNKSKIELIGVSGGFAMSSAIVMDQGRFLSREDCIGKKNVIVLSDITAELIFGTADDAVGKTVTISGNSSLGNEVFPFSTDVTVVGLVKQIQNREAILGSEDIRSESMTAFVPYTSFRKIMYMDALDVTTVSNADIALMVVPKDSSSVDSAMEYTQSFLQKKADAGEISDVILVVTANQLGDAIDQLLGVVIIVFVLIAAISLLVGGIGLMNTMLVTVTERTREIGIKKALGARNGAIRAQFLTESAFICLAACAVGILIASFIGVIVEANTGRLIELIPDESIKYTISKMKISFTPSPAAVLVSSGFSIAVGLVFGYYPANKGAKMQPVEALRYE